MQPPIGEGTKCVQKLKESFVEFEERFRAEVVRHSGFPDFVLNLYLIVTASTICPLCFIEMEGV